MVYVRDFRFFQRLSMSHLPPDDARAEAAVLQAMVLFSTLSTASSVWHAARERRAGRDPSGQEAASFVRRYLRRAAGALQALLMQLQAALIQAERAEEDGYVAALVRRYHDLMTLREAAGHLKIIHQRLLSLYPAVDEALVETARVLAGEGSALLDAEDDVFATQLSRFLRDALVFVGDLHGAVRRP